MKLRHPAAVMTMCVLTLPALGGPQSLRPGLLVFNLPNMAACVVELKKHRPSYKDANDFCKCYDRAKSNAAAEPQTK